MTRIALLLLAVNALLQAQGTPAKNPAANNPHLGNPQSIRSGMALYRTAAPIATAWMPAAIADPDLIGGARRRRDRRAAVSRRFAKACPERKCRPHEPTIRTTTS